MAIELELRISFAQTTNLHYVVWGDEARRPLLPVHGGRDHTGNWDRLAEALESDYCLYAIDLRGHGDSDWAIGSQYSLPEFTADLGAFLDHLRRDPVVLVGHSLGGAVVLQYAGVAPTRVSKVVAVEGLGPSNAPHELASRRMRRW